MEYQELAKGTVEALLEKYADPFFKRIKKEGRDEWEKFRIAFDVAFRNYIPRASVKYGKIKTILYRNEPQDLYDFFECPDLKFGTDGRISGEISDNLLEISHFLIIEGSGGVGKSTFLKHLFLDEASCKRYIPVFLELKDINQLPDDFTIENLIYQSLSNLGSTVQEEYLSYALDIGCFLFLLDGYDEIFAAKKDLFFRKFTDFCDRYSENQFIMTSRPCSDFISFQRFTVLELCELTKEQAVSLIRKYKYNPEVRDRFARELEEHLYDEHTSFASNPLLLGIMLLTYDNYAEIPDKLHLFYRNAFDTLYCKHDATKGGYRREMKCSLSVDQFKRIFAYFSFVTYFHGELSFSQERIVEILNTLSDQYPQMIPDDYIDDCVNAICLLFRDGMEYRYTHRSFQEYFSALFLQSLTDDKMQRIGHEIISKDGVRAAHDNVFRMLRDISTDRFENNILLPVLRDGERDFVGEDKYDFYLRKTLKGIILQERCTGHLLALGVCFNELHGIWEREGTLFLVELTRISKYSGGGAIVSKGDIELYDYLLKKYGKITRHVFGWEEFQTDKTSYELLKKTWIGICLTRLAQMRDELEAKRRQSDLDLASILG